MLSQISGVLILLNFENNTIMILFYSIAAETVVIGLAYMSARNFINGSTNFEKGYVIRFVLITLSLGTVG